MFYSDFTLARLKSELGITVVEGVSLFGNVAGMEASPYLQEGLKRCERFVTLVNTEKVRSEFLIAPILGEILERSDQPSSLFSGTDFNVDSEQGLVGCCDFILNRWILDLNILLGI